MIYPIIKYCIVQNFDGGKFWWIWRMDVELSKFTYQNFALKNFGNAYFY